MMYRLTALIPVVTLFLPHAGALAAPSYATPVAPFAASPHVGAPVWTPHGLGVVTGGFGSTVTTSLPGSGGEGLLINNGNGASTLLVPNGLSETVATPR
jgi:hypothetical protein